MQVTIEDLEVHRATITGHCYRMLGSITDADDAVQETMVRAWKSLDRFEGRAAIKTWLHRIATNVCLDVLSDRKRRAHPIEEGPAGTIEDPPDERPRTHWLEPVPDARAIPASADPAERAILKQSVRLAFVAALQHLPPRQRAALVLTEVAGFSAEDVAQTLETTVASVNSALQRARATLDSRNLSLHEQKLSGGALPEEHARLLDRFVDAFERYDVDALTSLLREDVRFSMPPYSLWLRGAEAVRGWLLGRGSGCRGSRLVPIEACGSRAFAQYKPEPGGGHRAWALALLDISGAGEIEGWISFLDVEKLFPAFGLPLELDRGDR